MRISKHMTMFASAVALLAVTLAAAAPAMAADPPVPPVNPSPAPAASGAAPPRLAAATPAADGGVTYDKFIKDTERQDGIFPLIRKDGKIYMELRKDQLNKEFYEHGTYANGLGGYGVLSGDDFTQEARIIKFVRTGPKTVAIINPQIRFQSRPGTPIDNAVRASTADSVQTVLPIAVDDKDGGRLVVDMAFLLTDQLDIALGLSQGLERTNPQGAYRLDPTRTYFGPTKAFPKNVIIEADQTFTSARPQAVNTVVDPRSIQFRIKYNFAEVMSTPGYMPRYADDRVGYWDEQYVQFERDNRYDNHVHYMMRWNLQASDPSRPSPAKKPLVYTLTNTIPNEYRQGIKDAILEWNRAFEKIGLINAIQVQDQPADPNWDPEDIRYNTIRWLTENNGGGFAEAQLEWDPRTGEIFRSGVLIDADIARFSKVQYTDMVGPASAIDPDPSSRLAPEAVSDPALWDPAKINPTVYGFAPKPHRSFLHRDTSMMQQAQFGAIALSVMGEPMPPNYEHDFMKAIILHEVGHDFGLGHNFIGHNGYTEAQIRDKAFTHRNGVATSVMEYAPINLYPRGTKRGDFWQTTLGTYDYHIIHWGYAPIPGAKTPDDEVATLNRWSGAATNPLYAFASDEDVAYNGHAVDPRIAQNMLTNKPIQWCETQLGMDKKLLSTLDSRYPLAQMPWEQERFSFTIIMGQYNRCASSMTHYIAGEYLTRSRAGDPGIKAALRPVSRSDEQHAFANLDHYVFSDSAWQISPATLNRLVYTEWAGFTDFAYNPAPRHDVSLTALANNIQNRALSYMFSPLVLQRLVDMSGKAAPGATMSTADLFAWTQNSVYGDLANGRMPKSPISRNLQRTYARMLVKMATSAFPGTPYDAQALARHELVALAGITRGNLMRSGLDLQTRAHLEALASDAERGLDTRNVITVNS
jgi:hypothetical protein